MANIIIPEIIGKVEVDNKLDVSTDLIYNTPKGIAIIMPVKLGEVQLPGEPLVSITAKKTIVETKMAGSKRQGTIKELIATDDYMIKISGVAINYASRDEYPREEIDKLHELFKLNESVEIVSPLLNLLLNDNNKVVIKEFSLPPLVGSPSAQVYEISCVTDIDWELEYV